MSLFPPSSDNVALVNSHLIDPPLLFLKLILKDGFVLKLLSPEARVEHGCPRPHLQNRGQQNCAAWDKGTQGDVREDSGRTLSAVAPRTGVGSGNHTLIYRGHHSTPSQWYPGSHRHLHHTHPHAHKYTNELTQQTAIHITTFTNRDSQAHTGPSTLSTQITLRASHSQHMHLFQPQNHILKNVFIPHTYTHTGKPYTHTNKHTCVTHLLLILFISASISHGSGQGETVGNKPWWGNKV